MDSIFKLGILLSVVDKVTGPTSKMGKGMTELKGKIHSLGPAFDKFKTYGLRVATIGALMIHLLGGTVMATVETQKALGELSSVGIRDLGALEKAGTQFSNRYAGTTKAQFIAAAYDIKSGISSLTDTGVAEFTKLAALTGKATKSTTGEMTSLFATGYGIYKQMYSDLSDMQFGEVFSAGISASVQAFKTTGSGMSQAISSLGATATTAKVPLQEQLAILGMLQATMSGSEAGTKYKALMQASASAGQKLKLSFVDVNNQLLSMPEILTKLKGKYGATLDAIEKMEIQKAFGTQEAVAVIDLLYGKVGDLTGNIQGLSTAMKQGTGFTEKMAMAMNVDIGSGIALLGQRWHNLTEVIGKQLIPVLTPLFTWIGNIINKLTQFAENHKHLTRVIVIGVAVLAVLAFTLGTLAAALGAVGLLFPGIVAGFALVKGALIAATVSTWGFTTALLANPITWVVLGVVALIAGLVILYKKFEIVRTIVSGVLYVLGYMAGVYVKLGKAIYGYMLPPLKLLREAFTWVINFLSSINLFEAGSKIFLSLVDGIKSVIMKPVEIVKQGLSFVRNLLPFSDAAEGPLSQLTLSGGRIMETLGAGVQAATPGLRKTMATALGGAVMTVAVAGGLPDEGGVPAVKKTPPAAVAKGNTDNRRTITIKINNLSLPGVEDGQGFIDTLERFAEGYDA